MNIQVLVLCLTAFVISAHAKTAAEWKSRVIYQLLTDRFNSGKSCNNLHNYCGGTFKGIVDRLDYIQNMGFDAIWISPVPENTPGGYHGYWAQDLYTINHYYGTSQDLKNLVQACHARDIWVMVDVVANHMGNNPNGNLQDFSIFKPFNQSSHYHPYCLINNWNDPHEVEYCRLANLPDLDQSNNYVSNILLKWIRDLINTYDFDGIRIDTVPEVSASFWSQYAASAGVFQMGEVDNGDVNYNAQYQGPLTATLNYPLYFQLKSTFQQHTSMNGIHDMLQSEVSKFKDVSVLGVFLDNHDNNRFLNINNNQVVLQNALAFSLFCIGIPIVYYGTEQGFSGGVDPANRESLYPNYNTNHQLYQFIQAALRFRRQIGGSTVANAPHVQRYVDDTFYAFTRGNVFIATTNSGVQQSRPITYHPYKNGQRLYNIFNTVDVVTVQNGAFQCTLNGGLPKIYYPTSQ